MISDIDSAPLAGALVAAPPGFRIAALDCDGASVFAAGFAPSSAVAEVWVGAIEPARRQISWETKLTVQTKIEPEYLVMSADHGSRGERFAISEYNQYSLCGGVQVFERAAGRWSEQTRMTQPDGETDILFGVPLLLRGSDLFTFEMPGAPTKTSVVHRYRRQGDAWLRSVVPFAPEASELQWQLAMSPSGDLLALTTEHRDGHSHVDLYARDAAGKVAYLQSVPLPRAASALAVTPQRIVVGLDGPADDGANIVLLERDPSGFRVRATVALPPDRSPSVGEIVAVAEHVVVSAGGVWIVDLETRKVVRRLTASAAGEGSAHRLQGPLASCGASLLATHGDALALFDLADIGR